VSNVTPPKKKSNSKVVIFTRGIVTRLLIVGYYRGIIEVINYKMIIVLSFCFGVTRGILISVNDIP
jgi:hypothetical protein